MYNIEEFDQQKTKILELTIENIEEILYTE